jgi:hypothetical protein
MGSLYTIEATRKYRTFTFMCTQEYKDKLDNTFVQSFLNESWPINVTGGDVQSFEKSKDGEVGDVAGLTVVTEGVGESDTKTVSGETKLYIRNAPGIGSDIHLWTEYIAPEASS